MKRPNTVLIAISSLEQLRPPERVDAIRTALTMAFKQVIEIREVPFIVFGDLNAPELAEAFLKFPVIVKPVLACVNVAGRAIKRDLGIDINTYAEKLTEQDAGMLAAYIKPMLPAHIAVPALIELDRYTWTDKEMRSAKGRWEVKVRDAINGATQLQFKKRKFGSGENYELDAAYPASGEPIQIGVDIKRIEARQDIHKRSDEIVNKALNFKARYEKGTFIAVVYFPFPNQHVNVMSRLKSAAIDYVFFAGESTSSIQTSMEVLAGAVESVLREKS